MKALQTLNIFIDLSINQHKIRVHILSPILHTALRGGVNVYFLWFMIVAADLACVSLLTTLFGHVVSLIVGLYHETWCMVLSCIH